MSEETKLPEILTPDSPRWKTFVKRLHATLAETSGCVGGANKDNAEAVMRDMGGVDIEASLEYFEDHGGYCDCEILLNVDRDWSWMERSNYFQTDLDYLCEMVRNWINSKPPELRDEAGFALSAWMGFHSRAVTPDEVISEFFSSNRHLQQG